MRFTLFFTILCALVFGSPLDLDFEPAKIPNPANLTVVNNNPITADTNTGGSCGQGLVGGHLIDFVRDKWACNALGFGMTEANINKDCLCFFYNDSACSQFPPEYYLGPHARTFENDGKRSYTCLKKKKRT